MALLEAPDFESSDNVSICTLALEKSLEEERLEEISKLNSLGRKVRFLHTSLLYYRNMKDKEKSDACHEAWRTMVKWLGRQEYTWRNLGHALGIVQADLDYIHNTIKVDPADVVLKIFSQNDNATLDKIVDVLFRMDHYDILKAVEGPLIDLAQIFTKLDSGYHSDNKSTKMIIKPKNVSNDLPPVLRKEYVMCEKDPKRPDQPIMRSVTKRSVKDESEGPILFLTYTEDGIATAYHIKYYAENWDDIPGVKVIMLNDKREEVFQNPEKCIREYFEKADYVVPIVTEGYLQEIRSSNPVQLSTGDNLDCKYVSFIYNLSINHYIHASGCMNTKVRSVIPDNGIRVLREISMYPDLMPWTIESKFNEQFKPFLKDFIKPNQSS